MNENHFNLEYLPKMHRIGKTIGVLGVVVSFLPAMVLGLGYGLWPDVPALLSAFLSAAASFGCLWFVEPMSFYPVVGPVGTYMAFLSGNISNMRIPCASMAQVAVDVEPGTDQGSIVATVGMGVSIIINILILSIGVIAGSSILTLMPPAVNEALNQLLPALFGALFIQYALKQKSQSVIMLVVGCLVYIAINGGMFDFIPGARSYIGTLICVFGSIAISMIRNKNK